MQQPPDFEHFRGFIKKLKQKYSYCSEDIIESCALMGYTMAIQKLDYDKNPKAFIIQFIVNQVRSGVDKEVRATQTLIKTNSEGRMIGLPSGCMDPLDFMINEENAELLNVALQELTETEKLVVWGKTANGMTLEHIGAQCGLTKERVRLTYERAIRKLRAQLSGAIDYD